MFVSPSDKPWFCAVSNQGQPQWQQINPAPLQTPSIDEAVDSTRLLPSRDRARIPQSTAPERSQRPCLLICSPQFLPHLNFHTRFPPLLHHSAHGVTDTRTAPPGLQTWHLPAFQMEKQGTLPAPEAIKIIEKMEKSITAA